MRLLLIALLSALAGCAFSHQTIVHLHGDGIHYAYPNIIYGNSVNMEIESNAVYSFGEKK